MAKDPDRLGEMTSQPEQEFPTPNIGAKGAMAPGSRFRGDLRTTFSQGALFNFSDEAAAAAGVPAEIIKGIFSGGPQLSLGETYEQNLAAQRAQLEATREAFPIAAPVSEVAGAVSTAFLPGGPVSATLRGSQALRAIPGVGKVLSSPALLAKATRGAGVGAGAGALAGAGAGEGTEDRLSGAATGAAIGAPLGAAAPAVGAVLGQGARLVKATSRALTAPVRSLANAETFAAGKVAEALKRDQLPMSRAARLLELRRQVKPDIVLADVGGKNTDRLLRAAADVPSDARARLVRGVDKRQEGQLDRLTGDLGRAFDDPGTYHDEVARVALARKQAAAPDFALARQVSTPWTKRLEDVLNRPTMVELVNRARRAAADRGEKFKNIFAKQRPDGTYEVSRVPDIDALHRVRVEIGKLMTNIKNRTPDSLGNMNLRDLTILKKDLDRAIINPPYKRAIKQWSDDSDAVNALKDGFDDGLKMEPEAITAHLKTLSAADADLWRLGVARKVANQLRDAGRGGTNRADILASPKYVSRLRAAFKDSATGKDFMRRLGLEQRMFETRANVKGGSHTAGLLAEGAEAGVEAEKLRSAADIGGKLVRGDIIGTMVSWANRAKNTATGLRPEVADKITAMLTSQNPAQVRRAQALVTREMARLAKRQGMPARLQRNVTATGLGAIQPATDR